MLFTFIKIWYNSYQKVRVILLYAYYENPKQRIFISHRNKSYNFSSHFHNNLEVAICFSGMQTIKIGETVCDMKSGDVAFIFPNIVHEYIECLNPEEETEVLAVIIDNKLLSEVMPEIFSKFPKNPQIPAELVSKDTVDAFRKILNSESDIALMGWTYVALSGLLNVLSFESLNNDPELAPKLIDYIDQNYKEPLSINHLANVFGYSTSYIAHIFCDQLKIPFRTYLGAVRSEYAASQIKTTKKSLTEIAYDSGYVSLNTFCRCFKKHFSITPSQYKKTFRE